MRKRVLSLSGTFGHFSKLVLRDVIDELCERGDERGDRSIRIAYTVECYFDGRSVAS